MAGGVFSGAKLNGMTIRESATDGSDFTNPDADYRRLFLGEDGLLHLKDSAGTVTDIGSGSGIPATIFDAKGDIIAASAADTAARLAVGANGTVLMADSAESTGLRWHPLSTVDATLSGDQTMTNPNTFYDGPSASFAAGTWLVVWNVGVALVTTAQTHDVTAKLWDGTTVYDEKANGFLANNTLANIIEISGGAIVTLGSTTTLKVSCADVRASSVIKRNVTNNGSANNTASRLIGLRIA